ncbi:MAG: GOLPH3/VPS74 family protein [Stackebrandtia sp.]
MVNLLEEVALLAYRDDNGRNIAPYLHLSLAGAALLELTLSDHIQIDESGRVDVVKQIPSGHAALDVVCKRVTESRIRHIISSWVQILSGVDLRTAVLEGLVDQRVLTHNSDRVLGFIPVNRYLPTEAGVESEIRGRLERAFGHSAGADVRTAALAGIVGTTFMERAALPQHKFGEVTKVFKELGQRDPLAKKVMDGLQLAVSVARSGSGSAVVG